MTVTTTLRGGGSLLVLGQDGEGLPSVLHWGGDLPDRAVSELSLMGVGPVPHNALDDPWSLTVIPTAGEGWLGTPGIALHRAGAAVAPRWLATVGGDDRRIEVRAVAAACAVEVVLEYLLDEHGVLTVSSSITSIAPPEAPALDLAALRVVLPLPTRATEILDLSGRWLRERQPQRHPVTDGTFARQGRRGRTGHDAALLLVAGTTGFGFRHGEVWAAHVAWSGNHEHIVERLPEPAGMYAAVLGGGELLTPGEVRLASGETHRAADVVMVWSDQGLDGLTRCLTEHQRSRSDERSRRPRPLVLNTWEAVYFDTDLTHLQQLADTAASIGVERFVLDDGWFGSRRDDTSGLGDWTVSADAWPGGLGPLVDHVRSLGMEFGLWFEPEMVNLDSDLARAHPDWVLGPVAGRTRPSRHQHVLDLAHPEAFAHVLDAVSRLVTEYDIDFIKWDHNRDLHEAVRSDERGADMPAVGQQTRATYGLLDELRRRHPRLEIESCSSGGGRVDLGILARTDRVWASDCNDPLERVDIQRWTGLLVPPERMGTHIGPPRAHTTQREFDLSLRMLVALGGHAGLEWDITRCSDEELETLRRWAALYRELRPLIHTGDVVRSDHPDPALVVSGVVARDFSEAVFTLIHTTTGRGVSPGLVPIPGLDPERRYRIRVRQEAGLPATVQTRPPPWFERALDDAGVELSGALLGTTGLPLPVLAPAQGFLLHLVAV